MYNVHIFNTTFRIAKKQEIRQALMLTEKINKSKKYVSDEYVNN